MGGNKKRQNSPPSQTKRHQSSHKLHYKTKLPNGEGVSSQGLSGQNYWRVLQNRGDTGAIRDRVLIPVFGRENKDSDKVRLITDLRALNKCHQVQRHHPQTWTQLLQTLQEGKLRWGITMDLKGYYHHLQLHPRTQRWMRFWYGGKGYQIQGMPFGWSLSPFWSHRLAQPIRRVLHECNIRHSWWVDHLLLLGEPPEEVERKAL